MKQLTEFDFIKCASQTQWLHLITINTHELKHDLSLEPFLLKAFIPNAKAEFRITVSDHRCSMTVMICKEYRLAVVVDK